MHPSEYEKLAALEAHYWWFVAKRRLLKQLLAQFAPAAHGDALIADVGCGSGATLSQLRAGGAAAIGLDYAVDALKFAKARHAGVITQGNIVRMPVADNSVDLVTALDVLYHQYVPNDETALREIRRVLKPGGALILTAPAFDFLRGPHDKVNLAARRYTLAEMRLKLVRTGFEVKKASYVYAFLLPPVFIRRWLQRTFGSDQKPASDLAELPAILNTILLALFRLELAWLKAARLPWGTSIVFVATKK